MHDREKLYRFLWETRDYKNRIGMKQGDVAKQFGISYQRLSIVMREFIGLGLIRKNKYEFTLIYDPDKIPWNDGFEKLRKKFLEYQKSKMEDR
jgi:hypothetical protein